MQFSGKENQNEAESFSLFRGCDGGCRNTKKYFQNACGVRHIRSIYPTVTYPAHTTILTGCYPASHGVISNTHFTTGSTEYEWLWDAGNVKVPDVITAAKDQGYTCGLLACDR